MPSGCVLEVGLKGIIISEYVSGQQWWFSVQTEGENYFTAKPFLFYQDSSDLHDSSDFVDDDLHLRQKSVVSPQCGDVIVNLVMGEVGESKRAVGADVETGGIKSLNDATAEHLAGVWLKKKMDTLFTSVFKYQWSIQELFNYYRTITVTHSHVWVSAAESDSTDSEKKKEVKLYTSYCTDLHGKRSFSLFLSFAFGDSMALIQNMSNQEIQFTLFFFQKI